MNTVIDAILKKVDSLKITSDFFFLINKTNHLRYAVVYETDNREFNLPENNNNIFQEIHDLMDSSELDNGIYSYYSIDKKVIHHSLS